MVQIRKVAKAWKYLLLVTFIVVIISVPSSTTFNFSTAGKGYFYAFFGLALLISIITLVVLGIFLMLNATNVKLTRNIFIRETKSLHFEIDQMNEMYFTQYLATTIVAWEIIFPIITELFASLCAGVVAVAAAFALFLL